MAFLIGMDEAGYGPNLGPLVISASVWSVPDSAGGPHVDSPACDLYALLAAAVVRELAGRDEEPDPRLAIADSKLLYRPGLGVGCLERGVLSILELLGHQPRDWQSLWATLSGRSGAHQQAEPWYAAFNRDLPIGCIAADRAEAVRLLSEACTAAGVRCCALVSRAVFPGEFNDLAEQFNSKGEALTRLTLELLRDTLESLGDAPVHVVCDKHGGRNRYAPQLQQFVTEQPVEVHGEATAESVYRWGSGKSRVEVRFRAGGEEVLPVALASMTSKYLRELALLAFNDFWCTRVPELRPTAGYPLDARRFKEQIAEHQATLCIDDRQLWRNR